MKQYTSLWLVCLLAVFSMTARAQEGIETKARPDYPALPFMLTFEAPAEGSASLSISADGETLTSPTTLHSGTEVTITVTPADGYRMASGYPKVYRTGTPSETVPATFKPDASSGIAYLYTFTMPDFPVTVEVEYEKIQSTVTFANPANGTLTLSTADAPGSSIVSGGEVASGTKVTIAATPNKGYQMVFGSLKVSGKVGDKTNTVPLQKEKNGTTYFLMPAYTVEAEVKCKYSINSLVYWVTYVHNVVYSFYRSMIYCYINSTQRCAGSIVIDIIPTNGADKRKFFPFAPYFPVTNVIKRYFYPYFPAIIGIKGYSFPYFPYLSGIMKIKTALYSLFSRLDWHKTVVFPCLGEIYEGIRSLSWEIPVT